MEELEKYKAIWKTVREAAHLQRDQDPFCCEMKEDQLPEEDAEEEEPNNMDEDETVSESSWNGVGHTWFLWKKRIAAKKQFFAGIESCETMLNMEMQMVKQMFQTEMEMMKKIMEVINLMEKMKVLRRNQNLPDRDIRDTFGQQWRRLAMWVIGQTFIMALRVKVTIFQKSMIMEFLLQGQDQEDQTMSLNRRLYAKTFSKSSCMRCCTISGDGRDRGNWEEWIRATYVNGTPYAWNYERGKLLPEQCADGRFLQHYPCSSGTFGVGGLSMGSTWSR